MISSSSTNDILHSECIPDFFDHDWECVGITGKQMGEYNLIYDIIEYVCLNCGFRFTELRPAGENLRGSYDLI